MNADNGHGRSRSLARPLLPDNTSAFGGAAAAAFIAVFVIVGHYDLRFVYLCHKSESRYAYLSKTESRILQYTHTCCWILELIKDLLQIASTLVGDLRPFWAPRTVTVQKCWRTTGRAEQRRELSHLHVHFHCSWLREGDCS